MESGNAQRGLTRCCFLVQKLLTGLFVCLLIAVVKCYIDQNTHIITNFFRSQRKFDPIPMFPSYEV